MDIDIILVESTPSDAEDNSVSVLVMSAGLDVASWLIIRLLVAVKVLLTSPVKDTPSCTKFNELLGVAGKGDSEDVTSPSIAVLLG